MIELAVKGVTNAEVFKAISGSCYSFLSSHGVNPSGVKHDMSGKCTRAAGDTFCQGSRCCGNRFDNKNKECLDCEDYCSYIRAVKELMEK